VTHLRSGLPVIVKRMTWEVKYGLLGYSFPAAPRDVIEHLISTLSPRGNVLELGCGSGTLLHGLRQAGYAGHYCGVDISQSAIGKASQRGDQKSSWIVSDIESFRSPFLWDAIVMVESIYYLQLTALSSVLRRISSMRTPDGSLVVRVHDAEKHREYINELYRVLPTTRKIGDRLFSAGSGESFESSVRATDAAAN
jgi:predicted TPR repeat methyltransferase